MQSLNTGESPVLATRVPEEIHAFVARMAGPGRGAKARYLRLLLEREMARALADPGHSTTRLTRTQEGTH